MNDLDIQNFDIQNFDIQNVKAEVFLRPIIRLGKTTPLPTPIAIFDTDPLHGALQEALEANRRLKKASMRVWSGFWVCKKITATIDGETVQSTQPTLLQGTSYFGAVKPLDTFQKQVWAAKGITQAVHADSGAWYPLLSGNRVYNLKSGELIYSAKT